MNDGWTVIERNAFEMVMVHEVPPPRWRRPFSWEVPDGESRPFTSG